MAFHLIPREEKFFELFEAQAAYGVEAAKVFKELVQNWDQKSPLLDKLRDIEHEADIATHEIMDKLNRTFVTPIDREDIHALAHEMDDIVDLTQSLASRMQLFRIEKTTPELIQLADILREAAETVRKAISFLKDENHPRRILDYCIEINRLENAGDRTFEAALGKLFAGHPEPLEVMKWKEIYEIIEEAIDKCEDVANVIESIMVKQA